MPDDANDAYTLHFAQHEVSLPAFLLSPEYRKAFDSFMAKTYRLAMARASAAEVPIDLTTVERLIEAVEADSETVLSGEDRQSLLPSTQQLIEELERLQRRTQWYMVLYHLQQLPAWTDRTTV